MLRVVDGKACVWGVWVGKFTHLDGAIIVFLALRGQIIKDDPISHYPDHLMKR